ncbi:hypothetical protein HPP92_023966 [Vanilla planifolia]|uniref:Uncharacterized protein n=1 Tax=Vanilla planifolia TaxID=51239 RepID=A0A835U9H3_VANPL|nr:hypothetical protein HPP92_023966 [Vanilla planifolia]
MFPAQLFPGVPSNMSVQHIQQAPAPGSFWTTEQVHERLKTLQETVYLTKLLQKELEEIYLLKISNHGSDGDVLSSSYLQGLKLISSSSKCGKEVPSEMVDVIKGRKVSADVQELLSLEAANSLIVTLKSQLALFNAITSQTSHWKEKSDAVSLAQKLQKYKRNKRWKKKRRKEVAQLRYKEHEAFDKADQDADEWRTREIAKDIAKRKMESMKSIAKLKASEERKRLESELELVFVVEKLQELRSIRIQKLKKQGHFLPEEDDKFLERVKAAVEEEERQAAAAADTHATRDAIATAEESRKAFHISNIEANDILHDQAESSIKQEQMSVTETELCAALNATKDPEQNVEGEDSARPMSQ